MVAASAARGPRPMPRRLLLAAACCLAAPCPLVALRSPTLAHPMFGNGTFEGTAPYQATAALQTLEGSREQIDSTLTLEDTPKPSGLEADNNCRDAVDQKQEEQRKQWLLQFCTKVPSVIDRTLNQPSEMKSWNDNDKAKFENEIAETLSKSDAVLKATKEFGRRLYKLLEVRGLTNDTPLPHDCDVGNAGFVGLKKDTIEQILTVDGNIREIFAVSYCIKDTVLEPFFEDVSLETLAEMFDPKVDWQTEAQGRAWDAISTRREEIKKTKEMFPDPLEASGWGFASYLFPDAENWSRYRFSVSWPGTGVIVEDGGTSTVEPRQYGDKLLWEGARTSRTTDTSEDTSTAGKNILKNFVPGLSDREKEMQECGNQKPCVVKWKTGGDLFAMVENPKGNPLVERAKWYGYRMVSGPSGTTQNMLQLMLLLGFDKTDLIAFRAAMVVFVVPGNDHSFIEVMLGASSLMPKGDKQWEWGHQAGAGDFDDFDVWPDHASRDASWGFEELESPWKSWAPAKGWPSLRILKSEIGACMRSVKGLIGGCFAPA